MRRREHLESGTRPGSSRPPRSEALARERFSGLSVGLGLVAVLALGCAHHGHEDHAADAVGSEPAEHAARHAAIDRLVAIEDIKQLKARFMRCIDTKNLPCLRDEVFAPGAEIYFKGGDYELRAVGWTEIEKFYQGAFSTQKFGMHNAHTPEITVDGDTARGTWYLHDIFVNLEEGWRLEGSALYDDSYARIDGRWRIMYTTYERLYEETTPRDPRTKLGSKSVKE